MLDLRLAEDGVMGGGGTLTGELGDWDIQEWRDMLIGVQRVPSGVTRGPGSGEASLEAGVWGSGDLVKPGVLGWRRSSLNWSEVRDTGVSGESRGERRAQILERLEVRRTANRAISTR